MRYCQLLMYGWHTSQLVEARDSMPCKTILVMPCRAWVCLGYSVAIVGSIRGSRGIVLVIASLEADVTHVGLLAGFLGCW